MATGKYLSLEEARKQDRLDRFCKEHPSTGDRDQFDRPARWRVADCPPHATLGVGRYLAGSHRELVAVHGYGVIQIVDCNDDPRDSRQPRRVGIVCLARASVSEKEPTG